MLIIIKSLKYLQSYFDQRATILLTFFFFEKSVRLLARFIENLLQTIRRGLSRNLLGTVAEEKDSRSQASTV